MQGWPRPALSSVQDLIFSSTIGTSLAGAPSLSDPHCRAAEEQVAVEAYEAEASRDAWFVTGHAPLHEGCARACDTQKSHCGDATGYCGDFTTTDGGQGSRATGRTEHSGHET